MSDLESHHDAFILNLVDTERTLSAHVIPQLFHSGLRLSSSCGKRRLNWGVLLLNKQFYF